MPRLPLSLEKRIPLAFVLTLGLQAGGAVWWAAEKEAHDRTMAARINELDQRYASTQHYTLEMVQRLARLETLAEAQAASMRRIENSLIRKTTP